jgi:hypothetical protein
MDNIITNGKPISGLYFNDTNEIIITFREKKIIKGIKLNIDWLEYEWYCNMKYYNYIKDDAILILTKEIVNSSTGCLLLPKLLNTTNDLPLRYCIVCSDWRKI